MTFSAAAPKSRLITANRNQLLMATVDVEKLISADHPARAIWDFVGRIDLSSYEEKIKSVEGNAGRPAYDPRLLVSLWIYAYSDGEGSAREIERLCGHDPAYQWLTGMEEISHHTLSDFRIDHGKELDELFTQVLGLLTAENLVTLKRTTQDGMKVKAHASSSSFRREATIREHLEAARAHVVAMGNPRREHDCEKRDKARKRAMRERQARLEKALEELPKIRAQKKNEEARKEARVSETDPEARVMKQGGNGGYAPSYNVQLTVDAEHVIIVNAGVSQEATDDGELVGAMEKVEERTGKKPEQVVADGGFTNHANIVAMADVGIDFIGSFRDTSAIVDAQYARRGIAPEFRNEAFHYDEAEDKYICPAGKDLLYDKTDSRRSGRTQIIYLSRVGTCAACPLREPCGGMKNEGRQITRIIEHPAVVAYHEKMKTDEAKASYKIRGGTAEFPNAWLKEKIGLRQFRTRGAKKTKQEALWACITYNIQQWIRLVWRGQLAAKAG